MIVILWLAIAAALFMTLNAVLSFTDGYRPVLSWLRLEFALLAWLVAWLVWRLS